MAVYYNERDAYAAEWIRSLAQAGHIPAGDVDDRPIEQVTAGDLRGYDQCHFFAGIGGWPYALRLAGWPDDRPVWTGSCPCQPFSAAGAKRGFDDLRHLWPAWHRLISERLPATIFGEQTAQAPQWLRLVRGDLEAMGYAVGAIPVEAASAGARHRRDRYWFVADAQGERRAARSGNGLAVDAGQPGSVKHQGRTAVSVQARGSAMWAIEPDVGRVAHGIPARVDKLRAIGNAIVPQVAQQFIMSFMEATA